MAVIGNNANFKVTFSSPVKSAFINITGPDGFNSLCQIDASGADGEFITVLPNAGKYDFAIVADDNDGQTSVNRVEVDAVNLVTNITPDTIYLEDFYTQIRLDLAIYAQKNVYVDYNGMGLAYGLLHEITEKVCYINLFTDTGIMQEGEASLNFKLTELETNTMFTGANTITVKKRGDPVPTPEPTPTPTPDNPSNPAQDGAKPAVPGGSSSWGANDGTGGCNAGAVCAAVLAGVGMICFAATRRRKRK
jgi:hypothetical protein